MTLYEMLDMLTAESPKIFLIAFVLMSLIQVAPIKINPWDKILTAIGSLFNKSDIWARVNYHRAREKIISKIHKDI